VTRRLVLLAVLAACSDGGTFAVPVELLMPASCDEFGEPLDRELMPCAGLIHLQLIDRESTMIQEDCPAFPELRFVSEVPQLLRDGQPSFDEVAEGTTVTLYVDVYSPGVLCGGTSEPVADPGGMLSPILSGLSEEVTLQPGARIEVPMACGRKPLDLCSDVEPPPTIVRTILATVRDLDDPDSVVDDIQEQGGFVSSGFPAPFGELTWGFLANGNLRYSGNGIWSGESFDDSGIQFPGCVGTLVETPGGRSIASCDGSYDPEGFQATATAYFLPPARVNALAAAAGSTPVIDRGLILGRVVDGDGNPVSGAVVEPMFASSLTVKYLDAAATGLNSVDATSTSGWFVVDETSFPSFTSTCCFPLQASRASAFGSTTGEVGLLEGAILGVVIELR
jgi:hypothetical protein